MGLGTTFTNSIVREIGRNYGKALSNSILGDKHSTPVRVVGGNQNDISRRRGTKYENKLDEYISKLEIKGKVATFNQGQNIYNSYFELVEEANSDGVIDLNELVFLVKKYSPTKKSLELISKSLIELDDNSKSSVINEKINDLDDFLRELLNGLNQEEFIKPNIFSSKTLIGFLLSLFCLDRVFLFPKQWHSYFWILYSVLSFNFLSGDINVGLGLFIFYVIINLIRKKGVWEYISNIKRERKIIDLTINMKDIISSLLN